MRIMILKDYGLFTLLLVCGERGITCSSGMLDNSVHSSDTIPRIKKVAFISVGKERERRREEKDND